MLIAPYVEYKSASWTTPGRVNHPMHFVLASGEFLREIVLILDLL